ncbi:MAG: hypothetical protein ACK4UJ_07085 [Leptonema sp. (in: bacteria)]
MNILFCLTIKEKVITGIEKIEEGGQIILISTAKASANALEKNIRVMKENTSKEAAEILLKYELQKKEYSTIKDKFKIVSIEFINEGEYCKITAIYNP